MPTDAPGPQTTIRAALRWRDMDELGHLNQAVYHELLEEARGALLAAAGESFPFVLARVELDYRHEVRRADGYVEIEVRVARVGTKSVTLEHDVQLPDGTVAASGVSVLVAWDMEARVPRALTAAERSLLGA
jgi:acyl-CoA thioester hydrolase